MSDQKRPTVPPDFYTEEYFRTACEGYDEFNLSEGDHLSRRLKAAFELAEVQPDMTILDVGCGRGEILRHCTALGANAYGIDYAAVAVDMSADVIERSTEIATGKMGVGQANARQLPFQDASFDRVLMFDVVEHLYPWELDEALREVHRVLKPNGLFIVHTAPNVWYDRYAYPFVRFFRRLMGQGDKYPKNPREFLVDHNVHVHVNEQSLFSLQRVLNRSNFEANVWLDSPPQNWGDGSLGSLRRLLFSTPPFRWFFEREVFAVAARRS
ncbi:class I SAM-dependent methyltransferase [Chloroflexota bacterium]